MVSTLSLSYSENTLLTLPLHSYCEFLLETHSSLNLSQVVTTISQSLADPLNLASDSLDRRTFNPQRDRYLFEGMESISSKDSSRTSERMDLVSLGTSYRGEENLQTGRGQGR